MSRRAGFVRAFLASVFGTGLSRVLGLVRDVVLANYLGASMLSDAFWAAYTVPGIFRRFVADEGLTGALVPAIAQAEEHEGLESAQSLASRIFTALLMMNGVLIALVVAAPEIPIWLTASGFAENPEKFALTVSMTRWMMPFLLMVSLVSFFEGLLNHRGHFFVPKVAPGLVSAGMAAGAVLLTPYASNPAWAVVAGFLVGGTVHVVVHLPLVWSKWGPVRLMRGFDDPRFRHVLRELGKVIVIGVFAQLNILVLRTLASYMGDGAVTRYMYSIRLVDLAQGAIAVAIGSALLPNVSKAVAAKDWTTLRSDLNGAFRLAGFLLIPAAVGLFVYAIPLTCMLFLRNQFTANDAIRTANALQLLTPFMLAVAGINIIKKVYFALDDRNMLLAVGAVGVGLTGVVGYALRGMSIDGLAIALSVASIVQLVIYVVFLKLKLKENMPLGELFLPLGKMTAASIPVGIFAYWAALHGNWLAGVNVHNVQWFTIGIVGAGVLYALGAWMLGVEELTRLTGRVAARFGR